MAFLNRNPRGRRAPPRARLGLLLVLMLFCPLVSNAQDLARVTEYRVKAAYLYRFCEYVEWPATAFADASSPLIIGVLGDGRAAENLEEIVAGRQVGGRTVQVRRLQVGEPIKGVHVLFITRSQSRNLAAMLDEARRQSTLTITEWKDYDPAESIINFVVIDDRVRFDIALESAKRSNLRISSRLLSVARNVINGTS